MKVLNWQQAYTADAIADEIALAAAHPKYHKRKVIRPRTLSSTKALEFAPAKGTVLAGSAAVHGGLGNDLVPQWRRNWGAAGPLIADLFLSVRHDPDEGEVTVSANGRRRGHTERYADHPGVDEAVVAAIVRAATQIFTEARDAA